MSSEKSSKDIVVTVDDFQESQWLEVLKDVGEHSYFDYHRAFSKAAQQAIKNEATSQGKVLGLLSAACSMMLNPESINEPFRALFVMTDGIKSSLPTDFTRNDLSFLECILPLVDNYLLKARIADILWLTVKPRKVEHALCAIDAYLQFPLDAESLLGDSKKAWKRAIKLSQILNAGAEDRSANSLDVLYKCFNAAKIDDGFHALWLSELLDLAHLDKEKAKDVAVKLEAFAHSYENEKSWHHAREYYATAIQWYKRINAHLDMYRLYAKQAEVFVSEATERVQGDNPSNLAAAHFLECAIQIYRKIPKKERAALNVDKRIDELHIIMNQANKESLAEMKLVQTPDIDISESIERVRNFVAGRKFPDVLIAFANIYSGVKVDEIAESAKKTMKQSVLRHIVPSTFITEDGRVAAKLPGIDHNSACNRKVDSRRGEMGQHYCIATSLNVKARIIPALLVINEEHSITHEMLLTICRNSYLVDEEREMLWAKGIYAGFDRDFIVATHLLIPQIEHCVRTFMKSNHIITTTLDSDGIEIEKGLSALLDDPDIEKSIDRNIVYELKALLADPIGPNLRNAMAHGLLNADGAKSDYAIYFWWLCCRFLINSVVLQPNENIPISEGLPE